MHIIKFLLAYVLVTSPVLAGGVLTPAAGPLGAIDCYDESWACFIEDFLGGSVSSTTAGELGWTFAGGALDDLASETNHIGIRRRNTTTSSGTAAYLTLGGSTRGPLAMGTSQQVVIFRLNQKDANTTFRCGQLNGLTASPTAGQYLEALDADTNWFTVTEDSNTPVRTDTGIAVDTAWHKLVIERIADSVVRFFLDGVLVATHTTGITKTDSYVNCVLTNSTTADKTVDYDYMSFKMQLSR